MQYLRCLAALVAIGALTSCGVPADSAPRAIPADEVPFGLLDRDEPVAPSTTAPFPAAVAVYLLAQDRLTEVRREAQAPVTPEKALAALLRGPTQQEATRGLRTAIGTSGVSATGGDGTRARVELGRAFPTIGASDQMLAIAQIVYTLTALPGIDGVTFTLGGRAIEVPRADGTLIDGALGRGDFGAFAPA